jgi:hypothetical protein
MNLYSQQAELLDPTNQGIKDAILKTTKEVNRKRKGQLKYSNSYVKQ